MRERSLMLSLNSAFFRDIRKWDPKANKVVISRDVIFDEKVMFQNTQNDEMRAPKNPYSDEYVVQVELETHNSKDDTYNAKKASTKDQQPNCITTGRDKHTIKAPTRYGFEDLVSYVIISSSGDPTNF